jgi:hypothetical protein
MCPTIKGLESLGLAKLQQHFRARHPPGAFAVNQMADDIERAHSVLPFISEGPGFGQIAQKSIESSGGAHEKGYGVGQVVFHRVPRFVDGDFPETGHCPATAIMESLKETRSE